MKRFNVNRKILSIVLCLILVSVFTLTIAYAALSVTLNIMGSAEVSSAEWDVHFDNVLVTAGSISGQEPKIVNSTAVTFSTILNIPGDFYEFTVDIVNDGTIDAMIENITKTPTLSTDQVKYLKYEVTYQNGDDITTRQLVQKDSFVRLKVRLEYRKDIISSDLPTSVDTLNLGLQLDYVQSDGSGSSVSSNGKILPFANGDINDIGTIVTIGSEQFYTIGTEGDNVNLFSMYNLYVGGVWDPKKKTWTPYGDEAIGMQDSNMIAGNSFGLLHTGTTVFSNDEYKGVTYNTYEGSLVEKYVSSYKNLLNKYFDINIIESRLVNSDEVANLFKCDLYEMKCYGDYPWMYTSSYWVNDIVDDVAINGINTVRVFAPFLYSDNIKFGVRPVIVISKDYFVSDEF